jgi:cell division protein FtsA
LVLTGGTAEIPGLEELAKKATGAHVRIAYPKGILGLPVQLRKPAFSASVGILLWGIKHEGERRSYKNGEKTLWGHKALIRRFRKKEEGAAV